MSIVHLNDINDYWSSRMFLRNSNFKEVMSRDTFKQIRSSLKFYPEYNHAVAVADPLWHSRIMLNHFMQNAASVAVPEGCSLLDENTIRCKVRTLSRSYMKNKPVKFGIRFYAVVGWKHAYLHSLWDNGTGNKTKVAPAEAYCKLFRDLRGPYHRCIDDSLVNPQSPSALWCLQMSHQTKLFKDSNKKRIIVMDNFYTRHVLARQVNQLSEDNIRIIGTVRFNNVDSVNRRHLKEAMTMMSSKSRGSWLLVQSFDKPTERHQPAQVAKNAGFIVFKDRNVVVFYTNDLATTPSSPIEEPTEETIRCVRGLAPLKRWIGGETFHRTELKVPAIIVAYNLFMNSVDRFDQVRSTNITARREKRVSMSIFTFLLDASIHNALALWKEINPGKDTDMKEFKCKIATQFVADHLQSKKRKAPAVEANTEQINEEEDIERLGKILSSHELLENIDKKTTQCHLCNIMSNGKKRKSSIYSCVQCGKGFHVNCFTFYHSREKLKKNRPVLHAIIKDREGTAVQKNRRNRTNLCCSTIADARLPFEE